MNTTEPLTIDPIQLARVCKLTEGGYCMVGSKWQNSEAEHIAWQTLQACGKNLKEHGEALSWAGKGVFSGRRQCGTNNSHGLGMLLSDGSLVQEIYTGPLTPSDPDTIAKDGPHYIVFRVTPALLDYLEIHCKS